MILSERDILAILSRRRQGVVATALRTITAIAEPFYATAMRARNQGYDRNILRSYFVDRPVVSVGNITTGGTGKTPAVHWLADALRSGGMRPAILLRGYRAAPGKPSDEQQLLADLLADPTHPPVTVHADADRVRGARAIYQADPSVNVIVLDDGFQHRRLRRDFNLVLIDATSPFGFGHVLPRGLLREPLDGLRRAHAILLTRTDQVGDATLATIRATLDRHAPNATIFHSTHRPAYLLDASDQQHSLESLRDQPVFAMSGIGNPDGFITTLKSAGATIAGSEFFPDHYHYADADFAKVREVAGQTNASAIITTEKDWVKLRTLSSTRDETRLLRLCVRLSFKQDDGDRLLEKIRRTVFPS